MLFKTLELFDGVVELRVGVGDLFAVDKQFKALGKAIVVAVALAQGRHCHRIIRDEGRLHQMMLAAVAKNGVNDLARSHFVSNLYPN